MSDFIQGALIAGIFALFGSVITAVITYKNTKHQAQKNLEQLIIKLDRDANEKNRDRLTETRKLYLIPLNEVISRWSVELAKLPSLSTSLAKQAQSSSDITSLTESQIYKDSLEFNEKMRTLAQQHEVLIGQISDKKLYKLIKDAITIQGEALLRRTELHETITLEKGFEILKDAIEENNAILEGIQFKLININKRIEGLLCGLDSE